MELISSLQDGLDEHKPSLFELLSEQQLAGLIPPSLRYLLVIATQRYPRYLLRILNSFDELYALAMVFVERHYLRTYGGGFTENFYGLKRERVLRIEGRELPRTRIIAPTPLRQALKLSDGDVWRNIAFMVGLPYLKRKLDEAYEIYAPQSALLGAGFNRDSLPSDATFRQKVLYYYKWFLRNVYPSLNAAYYFSMILFNLSYLFDSTAFSSPFLWLIQTRIRRMSAADYRAIDLAQQKSPAPITPALRPGQTTSILSPRTFSRVVLPKVFSGLKLALPTSIFLLKFLEWWHASDFARQLSRKATEGLELPPPVIAGLSQQQRNRKASNESQNSSTNTVSLGKPIITANASPSSPSSQSPNSKAKSQTAPNSRLKPKPPISSISHLPILTVPAPNAATSGLCPICLKDIATPTATQTGYVFCYTCVFRWVDGVHERQTAWMEGSSGEAGWGDDDDDGSYDGNGAGNQDKIGAEGTTEEGSAGRRRGTSREGAWESGQGRCPITGRRLLGGTDALRRIIA